MSYVVFLSEISEIICLSFHCKTKLWNYYQCSGGWTWLSVSVSWSESLRWEVWMFIFKPVDLCSGVLTFSRVMRWRELKPSDWSERYDVQPLTGTVELSITCLCFCVGWIWSQSVILPVQMITVNAQLFPSSVTNSLIAVGNDGLQERDRMVRACIAIICELGELLVVFKSVITISILWHIPHRQILLPVEEW